MIELITQTLAPFPAADETGVTAENPAKHPLAAGRLFRHSHAPYSRPLADRLGAIRYLITNQGT
jgi:hypothetical protein